MEGHITHLLEFYPSNELHRRLELISRGLVPWLNRQCLLEIRHGVARSENGEIGGSTAVVCLSVGWVDFDRFT